MKKLLLLLSICCFYNGLHAQINLAPYEMTLVSPLFFAPANEEMVQFALSVEAQQWPSEVLKYVLTRLRQNPFLTQQFYVQVHFVSPDQSKKTTVPVPINELYIKAFRTQEGFEANYVSFLSDTYGWLLEAL